MTIPANAKQCLACGSVIPEESSLCPMCPDPRIAKLESELAQARAEIERLGKALDEVMKQRDDNEDYLAEMYMAGTGLEAEWSNLFGPEEAIENVKAERDSLRAQLEQMCRPVTVEERVTITLQEGDFPYVVSVDGKKISAFGYEHSRDGSGAADFRLSLIAKLKAEGTVSPEAGEEA